MYLRTGASSFWPISSSRTSYLDNRTHFKTESMFYLLAVTRTRFGCAIRVIRRYGYGLPVCRTRSDAFSGVGHVVGKDHHECIPAEVLKSISTIFSNNRRKTHY